MSQIVSLPEHSSAEASQLRGRVRLNSLAATKRPTNFAHSLAAFLSPDSSLRDEREKQYQESTEAVPLLAPLNNYVFKKSTAALNANPRAKRKQRERQQG